MYSTPTPSSVGHRDAEQLGELLQRLDLRQLALLEAIERGARNTEPARDLVGAEPGAETKRLEAVSDIVEAKGHGQAAVAAECAGCGTSPRVRGEVGALLRAGGGGLSTSLSGEVVSSESWKRPPTLSPHALSNSHIAAGVRAHLSPRAGRGNSTRLTMCEYDSRTRGEGEEAPPCVTGAHLGRASNLR